MLSFNNIILDSKTFVKKNTFIFTIISFTFIIRFLALYYNNLLVEEAYYWDYSQHFDFSYLDHPPMVAFLIKISTAFLGLNEFAVRISTFFCWLLAVFFNVKLTNLIKPNAGKYTFFLLSILPFFFLHSLVITPDAPLIACWSASLYYLYRVLVLGENTKWYWAGLWLGLGMLSKYTIVLLGLSTFIYIVSIPNARHWFLKKEPYLCILIVTLLFTPVIYWNATHEWVSFLFQSSRRFNEKFHSSFPEFITLLLFFLMPAGLYGLFSLTIKKHSKNTLSNVNAKSFMKIFTLVPLAFFCAFSLFHRIKFNWIGPGLLAITPWLAISLMNSPIESLKEIFNLRNSWIITSVILLLCYGFTVYSITSGKPEIAHRKIFKKLINWQDLTQQMVSIAQDIEQKHQVAPVIIPLDVYNINSELTFYQKKLALDGDIKKTYSLIGQHVFGCNSLMYKYWRPTLPSNQLVILFSDNLTFIKKQNTNDKLSQLTPVKTIYSRSQGAGNKLKPFYYRTAMYNN